MRLFFVFFFSYAILFSTAQNFTLEGYWKTGSSGINRFTVVEDDQDGNQYASGSFDGSVDFDPNPNQAFNISGYPTSATFVQKIDSSGNHVWTKAFFTLNTSSNIEGTLLASAPNGGVLLVGSFWGGMSLMGINRYSSSSSGATFLVFLDSSGTAQWGYSRSNASDYRVQNVYVSDEGIIYVVGYFQNTVDFDPSSAVVNRTSSGGVNGFVQKFSLSGQFLGVKTIGGGGGASINDISISQNGEIYFVGGFSASPDLAFGVDTLIAVSQGAADAFIMKTDSVLNTKWVKTFGNLDSESAQNINIENNGSLLVSGLFSGSLDLDPDPNAVVNYQSQGSRDIFLLRLDTAANFLWAGVLGGQNFDELREVRTDTAGSIYVIGGVVGSIDVNPDTNTVNTVTIGNGSSNDYGTFVVQIGSSGNFKRAAGYKTNLSSMRVLPNGLLRLFGGFSSYSSSFDVDPGPGQVLLTSTGQVDLIWIDLRACENINSTAFIAACNSYTLPWNGQTVTSSGNYSHSYTINQSCDSTIIFTIDILTYPDSTIIATDSGLVAMDSSAGLTYQWFDCIANQVIAGENNRVFKPTSNGVYALIISNGACTDTSNCLIINNIGLIEDELTEFLLFPNPTKDYVIIKNLEWLAVEFYNTNGKVVLRSKRTERIDLSFLPAGVYFLKVQTVEGTDVIERLIINP